MLLSSAEKIVSAMNMALAQGQSVWLVTVLSTWGSSPRPPGSMMLWSLSTGMIGSVSGGCAEEKLLTQLQENVFPIDKPSLVQYGGAENKGDLHLPCGGLLNLLVEPVQPHHSNIRDWHNIAEHLSRRSGVSRTISFLGAEWLWQASPPFAPSVTATNANIFIGPARKLLIVGANLVAEYLADFARALDFVVTICDPNLDEEKINKNAQVEYLKTYPDGIVASRFSDSCAAVVAVSHDPRIDDMALLEALGSDAFYIGAMGSNKTSAARRERLQQLGVSDQHLQKLNAPIGLAIGSKTPAEIAVSIAADLIRAFKPVPVIQQ